LVEEFKYGIVNYDYATIIKPIVYSDLKVRVTYQDSLKSYVVQVAGLLAGTVRRTALDCQSTISENLSKFVDFQIILP